MFLNLANNGLLRGLRKEATYVTKHAPQLNGSLKNTYYCFLGLSFLYATSIFPNLSFFGSLLTFWFFYSKSVISLVFVA